MTGVQQEAHHLRTHTVFLVDDDAEIREYIEKLLKSVPLICESYATAKEFMDAYNPDRPGCLLLDLRMPELSGIDLQKILIERGIFIPVIIVTGHADIAITVRAIKMGAIDVIEKPFNHQILLDRINEALRLDLTRRTQNIERKRYLHRANTLTPREHEVMDMILSGKSNKEIAFDLGISRKTYEIHRARVMEKMQATNAAELVLKSMIPYMHKPAH